MINLLADSATCIHNDMVQYSFQTAQMSSHDRNVHSSVGMIPKNLPVASRAVCAACLLLTRSFSLLELPDSVMREAESREASAYHMLKPNDLLQLRTATHLLSKITEEHPDCHKAYVLGIL